MQTLFCNLRNYFRGNAHPVEATKNKNNIEIGGHEGRRSGVNFIQTNVFDDLLNDAGSILLAK